MASPISLVRLVAMPADTSVGAVCAEKPASLRTGHQTAEAAKDRDRSQSRLIQEKRVFFHDQHVRRAQISSRHIDIGR